MLRTRVYSVQTRLNQVIQLKDESTGLGEERCVSSYVLDVSPNDTISTRRFGCRGSPDYIICYRIKLASFE